MIFFGGGGQGKGKYLFYMDMGMMIWFKRKKSIGKENTMLTNRNSLSPLLTPIMLIKIYHYECLGQPSSCSEYE